MFLLLFSLFLYEEEPEPVKKKYLEPERVKSGPALQHCTTLKYLFNFSRKIKFRSSHLGIRVVMGHILKVSS